MKKVYIAVLFIALLCNAAYAQRGKNGALTVSSTIEVNEYTTLTSNAAVGNTSITVANSALNSNNRFSKNLAPGDLIMIIQMQGASILSGVQDSTWGSITAYNNSGANELREVLSVPNSTTINLTCPLVNSYIDTANVQIVRIPRYSTLTVAPSGVIIADAWNGQTGGIIAVEVLGATTINGGVDADTLGFRGGQLINMPGSDNFVYTYATAIQDGGEKGEGIAGYQAMYNIYGGMYGRGAAADAGGGGDAWNTSGGGGGNGGNIAGYNGNGNPDISTPSWASAWNLEYSGFATNVSSGGGRGGYGVGNSGVNPLTTGPSNPTWGYWLRLNTGGKGGRPLDYSTGRLFMGGGAGAGHEDDDDGGAGGNGGGLIYFSCYGTVSGSGQVSANGAHGGNNNSTPDGDGSGGGGAGGTIIINSVGNISGISLASNGGAGGSQFILTSENEGPAGGGGGGYVATSNVIASSVLGGVNGTTNATDMSAFPPDGATKGAAGSTGRVTNFIILTKNDTVCDYSKAVLTATLSGTVPLGITIGWYDSITGGSLLGSGAIFTTPIITKTTVFYVSTCPGDYRQADTVVVKLSNLHVTSSGDSICKGDTVLLEASGGGSYHWSTNQTTSSIKVAPVTTTTYSLTANSQGCSYDTTFTVYVLPHVTGTVRAFPDTICPHGVSTLTAVGGGGPATYKWSNGSTYDTVHVSPSAPTTYTVTIYGKCDTSSKTVTIYIGTPVLPTIKGTSLKCKGTVDTLKANGANSYLWSNGITGVWYITGNIEADSTVKVIGFSAQGCPDTASFRINIYPSPVVSLSDTNTCRNNPVTIYATANDSIPLTYLWTPGGATSPSITVPDTGQTYVVTVSNGCIGQKSITLTPVIPLLAACCDKAILLGDDTILTAQGLSSGGIKSYSWSPAVTCLNPPLCDSVQVAPTVTTTYTVTGTDSIGCQVERVVTIVVEPTCSDFIVPNVFTPTEAGLLGLNNVFYIKAENMSAWSIQIYDRWGLEMFKSTNPVQYWNGNAEGGGQAPAGVYYYIINGTCQNNTYKKDGFVQLIR